MAPQASDLVRLGIPALTLLVVALVALGVTRTSGGRVGARFALGAGIWLAVTATLGATGFLARFDGRPPPLLVLLLPTLGLPLWLGFSRVGDALMNAPIAGLVAFHGFRLPLELVMHRAATDGVMPEQMSFMGLNFDIVTGATALVVGALAARRLAPRWLLLAWNALGTALLLTILIIAVASMPLFGAFGREPQRLNTWVAFFPYVWLPAGMVSAATLGHVLLWRRLLVDAMRGRAFAPVS
jgi:hypothetical protein